MHGMHDFFLGSGFHILSYDTWPFLFFGLGFYSFSFMFFDCVFGGFFVAFSFIVWGAFHRLFVFFFCCVVLLSVFLTYRE